MTKKQKRNFIDYLEKSVNKTQRIKEVIETLKNKGWK